MTLIEGMKGALMCRMYEFRRNCILKSIDDVTSRDVIEKTNQERHVRWKEYGIVSTKQSQVPKQLVSRNRIKILSRSMSEVSRERILPRRRNRISRHSFETSFEERG